MYNCNPIHPVQGHHFIHPTFINCSLNLSNSILSNSFNPLNREPDSLKALKAPLFEP